MKKITVTLSDKAEAYFDEIMYSLPKYADGSGMCTQSQAINYTLVSLQAAEKKWENEKEPQQPSEEALNLISKAESDYIVLQKKDGIYDLAPMKPFDDWHNISAKAQPAVSSKTELRQCKSCGYVTNEPKAPQPAVSEEEIGDCFKIGESKGTIVNKICNLFPEGFIKRPIGNQTVNQSLNVQGGAVSEGKIADAVDRYFGYDENCWLSRDQYDATVMKFVSAIKELNR